MKSPNILNKTRAYLIGHMEYKCGRDWRDYVKKELEGRNITLFDPYHKPFVNETPEDDTSRDEMYKWMKNEQYDLVQQRMWKVRSEDLRLIDISDFFIVRIAPKIASWGSAEEIITAAREKKPIFLSIEGGKKVCPLWLLGVIPHKYIYNDIDEVISTIKAIDDGVIKMSSDRWRLLRPELR
jgi:hypothetical protein